MNVLVSEESLKNIGDAIREKIGAEEETKYLPGEMATAISSIVTDTTLPSQTKEASPSLDRQDITADGGYQLSMVRVNPVTSDLLYELDNDFVAENIKEGVNLFGVDGESKPSVDFSVVTTTSDDVLLDKVFYNNQGEQDTGSMPIVEAGTPSISVDSATGVITASVSQSTGYVQETSNTSTLELSTYSGGVVSPTLGAQTIVNAGVYTTGAVEVAGITSSLLADLDSDFVAGNIVSGVNLFGLEGTATSGGADVSGTTAEAGDVLSPEYFCTQDGTLTQGTMQTLAKKDFGLTLSDDGLVTPTVEASGYVAEGTELKTLQLDVMEGYSVVPGTSSKVAVPKGYYTTGDVTVSAISSSYKKVAVVTATPTSATSISFKHSLADISGALNIMAHTTEPIGSGDVGTNIVAFSSFKSIGSDVSGTGYIYATLYSEEEGINYNIETVTYNRALQTVVVTLNSDTKAFLTNFTYRAIIMIE